MFAKNLKYYRLKNGLSKKDLAEKVGLSAMAITNYENGARMADMAILKNLASVLGVKVSDFLERRNENLRFVHAEFRKNSKLSKTQQQLLKEDVEEYLQRFYSALDLLGGDLLPDELPVHCLSLSKDAEQDALALRRYLKVAESGPIRYFVPQMENKGIIVHFIDFDSDCFSGMNGNVNGRPYLVVNNQMTTERIRSTIVHELAHMVFDWSSEKDEKWNEEYATSIAGAFLFPKEDAVRELGVYRSKISPDMIAVAKEYGISMFLLTKRAYLCGIVTHQQETLFYQTASKLGWRKNEPSRIEKEEPNLFQQLVFRGVCENEISIQRGAELLGKSFDYVSEQCLMYQR